MWLAADVGGTKTLVGLFDATRPRPARVAMREYQTLDHDGLGAIIGAFMTEFRPGAIKAVCAGVAGPITGETARLTNVPWEVSTAALSRAVGGGPAALLNDLEALAWAVPVLAPEDVAVLQPGRPDPRGNIAVIAAGTGLGQAILHRVDGGWRPLATEAGHADFAARTRRELGFVAWCTARDGRTSVEHVVSGRGLANLAAFTHAPADHAALLAHLAVDDENDLGAAVSAAADQGRCAACREARDLFISAYGAEAGNLALRSTATAGLFLGGGIAPKLLDVLRAGAFLDAFLDKAPMDALVARVPVAVILDPTAGLLGAAVRAGHAAPA